MTVVRLAAGTAVKAICPAVLWKKKCVQNTKGIVKREEGKDKEGKKKVGNEKTRGPGPSE
jgi:hypothetical protein